MKTRSRESEAFLNLLAHRERVRSRRVAVVNRRWVRANGYEIQCGKVATTLACADESALLAGDGTPSNE
jgi:hypothetical protein